MPLIFVCSAPGIRTLRKLFLENDYFAFDSQKVSIYSHMKNTSFILITLRLRIPLLFGLGDLNVLKSWNYVSCFYGYLS